MIKDIIASFATKHIKKKLDKWTITEEDTVDLFREIRLTLLDADVNLLVVKNFIKSLKEKVNGMVIEETQKMDDVVLTIIKEELVKLLGENTSELQLNNKLTKIMMVGLNGAGKTTTCAKIANYIKKQGKKPLVVGLDIYRPAAFEQLKKLCIDNNIEYFDKGTQNPIITAKDAVEYALNANCDVIIYDTAGRMQTNTELMNELKDIKSKVNPDEILLVVDAMAGQEINNVANEFNSILDLTGFIATKMDNDARFGAIMSLIALTQIPVKFSGTGEKISNLDKFHPDRVANRILGLGDIMTFAEKAKENIDEDMVKKSMSRMMSGKFDLEDLMTIMNQVGKMGSLGSIVKMFPAFQKISESQTEGAEQKMNVWTYLMSSMTKKEKRNPHILERETTRKIRIVKGSGRKMDELNKLLSEWKKIKTKMDEFGKLIKSGKNPLASLMNGGKLF
ncbi:MAG: signal recognition particle protein [Mycoplasmataceae bacterium]|nr:signal recognition particle protein [Mycoplasmataceae bacterium]